MHTIYHSPLIGITPMHLWHLLNLQNAKQNPCNHSLSLTYPILIMNTQQQIGKTFYSYKPPLHSTFGQLCNHAMWCYKSSLFWMLIVIINVKITYFYPKLGCLHLFLPMCLWSPSNLGTKSLSLHSTYVQILHQHGAFGHLPL